MNFTDAIRTGFKEAFNFRGRALRSEYWWWTLFYTLLTIAVMTLDYLLFGTPPQEYGVFGIITHIVMIVPSLAVTIRRLHDVGRTGNWVVLMMLAYIPMVYLIWQLESSYSITTEMFTLIMVSSLAVVVLGIILLAWMMKPGSPQENEYGPPRLSLLATPKAPGGQSGIDA